MNVSTLHIFVMLFETKKVRPQNVKQHFSIAANFPIRRHPKAANNVVQIWLYHSINEVVCLSVCLPRDSLHYRPLTVTGSRCLLQSSLCSVTYFLRMPTVWRLILKPCGNWMAYIRKRAFFSASQLLRRSTVTSWANHKFRLQIGGKICSYGVLKLVMKRLTPQYISMYTVLHV